jgi:hypothetical protein
LTPVIVKTTIHDLLIQHGYKLIDDAWISQRRLTYIHDDDATREFIVGLGKVLRSVGWETHPNILRAFRHPESGEIVEIELGGSDATGHFLHLLKSS